MLSQEVSPYYAYLGLLVWKHVLDECPIFFGFLFYPGWSFLFSHQTSHHERTNKYHASQIGECSDAKFDLLLIQEPSRFIGRGEPIVYHEDGWPSTHELSLSFVLYGACKPIR